MKIDRFVNKPAGIKGDVFNLAFIKPPAVQPGLPIPSDICMQTAEYRRCFYRTSRGLDFEAWELVSWPDGFDVNENEPILHRIG